MKAWMNRGGEAYGQQRWEEARDAYRAAWELRPHFAVAANLADVELRLGAYREAAEHLRFFLANLPPEREVLRADGEKRLAECRAHLATVRVAVAGRRERAGRDGRARRPRDRHRAAR
jgi:tetratricopeptide (TPR) repeat protein